MNKRMILRLMVSLYVLTLALGLVSASAFGSVIEAVCRESVTNPCPGFAIPGGGEAIPHAPGPFRATIGEVGNHLQFLPFLAFGGDVVINEPNGAFSDDVQFNSAVLGFGHDVFMFSEQESPFDALDVTPPPGFVPSPNAVFVTEVGSESVNGVIYKVISPDGHVNAVYTIISDVPEPGTLSLLGIGGLALFKRLRRKF